MTEKKLLVSVTSAGHPLGDPPISQVFLKEGDHVSIHLKDGRVHVEVSKEVK